MGGDIPYWGLDILGEPLHEVEIIEKFLGEDPYHNVGRYGQEHADHPRNAPCQQQHEEDL